MDGSTDPLIGLSFRRLHLLFHLPAIRRSAADRPILSRSQKFQRLYLIHKQILSPSVRALPPDLVDYLEGTYDVKLRRVGRIAVLVNQDWEGC